MPLQLEVFHLKPQNLQYMHVIEGILHAWLMGIARELQRYPSRNPLGPCRNAYPGDCLAAGTVAHHREDGQQGLFELAATLLAVKQMEQREIKRRRSEVFLLVLRKPLSITLGS